MPREPRLTDITHLLVQRAVRWGEAEVDAAHHALAVAVQGRKWDIHSTPSDWCSVLVGRVERAFLSRRTPIAFVHHSLLPKVEPLREQGIIFIGYKDQTKPEFRADRDVLLQFLGTSELPEKLDPDAFGCGRLLSATLT